MDARTRAPAGVSAFLAAALLLTACQGDGSGPGTSGADDGSVLRLDLGAPGATPDLTQLGSARLRLGVSTTDGGRLSTVASEHGGVALRYPRFSRAASYPRAVVRAVPVSGDLDPGVREMEWGADVRLDRVSRGRPEDNGDNVLQRGLSSDKALFKAEVDKDRAACTVRGDEGTLVVRSRRPLVPEQWYRIRCVRERDTLRVEVTSFPPGGALQRWSDEETGPIGSVTFADPDIPIAVGGKLAHDGSVVTGATDQFNGQLERPVLVFGE